MKTINTIYQSKSQLETFLNENSFNFSDEFLIQVFTGILDEDYIKQLLLDIQNLLPNAKIIGTSTDGEITNGKVSTHKTTISITKFNNVTLKLGYIEYTNLKCDRKSAQLLAKKVYCEETKVIIAFADGLNTNGEVFLNGLSSISQNVVIAGGLSGDNGVFDKTFVFINDKVLSNGAVAVSLNGYLNVATEYSFNWQPIGKQLTITKAKDNIVYTIDDKTAYETYKYYLGEEVAQRLPAIGIEFPLIIKRNGINIARAVVGLNDDESLVFAGDLHKGDTVQFGYGDSESILNSSTQIISNLSKVAIESVFVYSCMARRRFIPDLIEGELEPLTLLGSVAGFFTYGEFFTQNCSSSKELLNQTMTVLALSESNSIKKIAFDEYVKYDDNAISTRALSHLINVTSNELQEINEDLEISIKREKKIVSNQEKFIFDQTKMAQMGDMIGNIAHQWRQPLGTISTAASSVQIQKDLGVLSDEFLNNSTNKIISNVNYLAETISIFRNFLKDDKEYKEHILQDTIKEVLTIVGTSLKDNHIKLIDEVDYDVLININMVAGELSQVIINIINNAKDAIVENNIENSFVELKCIKEDDIIRITIQDNAGGIPEHIMPRIFEPYFTTKGSSNGTGLGLHMSHSIITKNMNGKLYVKNDNDGAKFYIELPLS